MERERERYSGRDGERRRKREIHTERYKDGEIEGERQRGMAKPIARPGAACQQ